MFALPLLIITILDWVFLGYIVCLLGRVVFDWMSFFGVRDLPGPVIVVANVIFAVTDPPLRFLRRFIPPARIGNVSLDVAFVVLFIAVSLLRALVPKIVVFLLYWSM